MPKASSKHIYLPEIEKLGEEGYSGVQISDQLGIPYTTLVRWLREEDIDLANLRMQRAIAMSEEGKSLAEIAEAVHAGTRTVSRWLSAMGTKGQHTGTKRKYKKDRYGEQILQLHQEGKTVYEIAEAMEGKVYWSTIAQWLKEDGQQPRYGDTMHASAKKDDTPHPRREEALRRYLEGDAARTIATDLKVGSQQVEEWAREDGIWEQGGKFKRRQERRERVCDLYDQGQPVDEIVRGGGVDYYTVRLILDETGRLPYPDEEKPDVVCPCGKLTGTMNKYCCDEHRREYGVRRQKDPENYLTFECLGCGISVTRRKKQSVHKYCSNACAAKHTKVKKHYALKDLEIVFDSSYECLFYGLCMLHKIPIERYDRAKGIAWKDGAWYAPDFYLPQLDMAIELKGFEDADDPRRWAAYREQRGPLAVLDGEALREHLGAMVTRDGLLAVLWDAAKHG